MARTIARIVRKKSGGAELFTPYNADFVADLKELVVWADRRWSNDLKVWWVGESHVAAVEELILRFWPEVELVDVDGVIETKSRAGFSSSQGRFL